MIEPSHLIPVLSEWLGVIAVAMIAGVSLRFKYRPIGFVYTRRELIISAILYLVILGMVVAAYLTGSLVDAGLFGSPELNLLALAVAAAFPFALSMIVRRQPLKSTGLNPLTRSAALRLSLMNALLIIVLRGKVYAMLDGVTFQEISLLFIWLGICFFEETIFRGFLQLRLVWALKAPAGFFLTAILFTLWKLPVYLADPTTLPINLGFVFLQSLVLSWVMHKSGNVIAPAFYRALSTWLFFLS